MLKTPLAGPLTAQTGLQITNIMTWWPWSISMSNWLFRYLTRANTVSEETVGDGAMMTTGSPSSMSSQRTWRWIRTDWKHLHGPKVTSNCNVTACSFKIKAQNNLKTAHTWRGPVRGLWAAASELAGNPENTKWSFTDQSHINNI